MNDVEILIEYAACLGVGMQNEDYELTNNAWKRLPSHLRQAIEEKEEEIDKDS